MTPEPPQSLQGILEDFVHLTVDVSRATASRAEVILMVDILTALTLLDWLKFLAVTGAELRSVTVSPVTGGTLFGHIS
jgi:hypothetical protein